MGERVKKIGIVTLSGSFNYGNRLQNYATTRIFEKMGYRAETLKLEQSSRTDRLKARLGNVLFAQTDPAESMTEERRKRFASFDERIPVRAVPRIAPDLADDYEYFAVGSDQVWNPSYMRNPDLFFLRFARRNQRIALAPSIGVDGIPPRRAKEYVRGIGGFDNISVREDSGAKLIRDLTGRDAAVLVDPTLTLSAREWLDVSNDDMTPDHPYVFAYLLGDCSQDQGRFLATMAEKHGADIVRVSDRDRDGELALGPGEFISIVATARHVITDSFHGSVFALLFKRPLTIFRREGGADMFSRLDTLSNKFNLADKIFGNEGFETCRADEYSGFDSRLAREQEAFMRFLDGALNAGMA